MLLTGAIGGKPWVTGQVRAAQGLAELAIERARVQRNDNIPVAGLISTIGHNGMVARPHRLRIVPGKEIQFGEVPQEPYHAVVQPDIDDLPAARALPLLECRKNPQRGKQATGEVAHRQAQLDRRTARLTRDAHRAGHRLGDDIVGGAVTQGPGLPKTRDGADDQPWIGSQQTVWREPEPCQDAWPKIFHERVTVRHQVEEHSLPSLLFEIDHEALFVAIDREEIVTLATAIGWDDARLIADAWGLDLKNLGPKVSQHHGTIGAGQHACQVENTDTLERASIGRRCHRRAPWDAEARLGNSTVAVPKAVRSPR